MELICFCPTVHYLKFKRILRKISDDQLLAHDMSELTCFSHYVIVEDIIASVNEEIHEFGERSIDMFHSNDVDLSEWLSNIWDLAYDISMDQVIQEVKALTRKSKKIYSDQDPDLPISEDVTSMVEKASVAYANEAVTICSKYFKYFEPLEVKLVEFLFHEDYVVHERKRI